jgi:hypothetical protein
VATGYDKRDYVFRGTLDVASIKICPRNPVSQDPPGTAYSVTLRSTASGWRSTS